MSAVSSRTAPPTAHVARVGSTALCAAAVLAALAVNASADTIKPPAGWKLDAEQSKALGAKLREVGVFDMPDQTLTNADVYVPPERGVSLIVVVTGAKITTQRPEAARAAVDDLHNTAKRAGLSGAHIVEDGWQEKVDPDAKQIEATLAFRDTDAKTTSTSRRLIVGDAATLIAVTGECFASADANAKLVADCKAALATLDPGIAPDKRVELALAATGSRPAPSEPPPSAASPGKAEPARMGDATRAPLPPMTMPAQDVRTSDRRPVYVGIGLVVLAAVFWWNRRRRARREDKADE